MTWVFSVWVSCRASMEAFPPWKERFVYSLIAVCVFLALDIIL
jgi:hypothetical protein